MKDKLEIIEEAKYTNEYKFIYTRESHKNLIPNINDKVYRIRTHKVNTVVTETTLKYDASRGIELAITVIRILTFNKIKKTLDKAKTISKLRNKRLNYHYIKR